MESTHISLPQLQQKNRLLEQKLAEIIQETFGGLELVEELGNHLISNPGLQLSITLSVSLTKDGPELLTHSNSLDIAKGASMNGVPQWHLLWTDGGVQE